MRSHQNATCTVTDFVCHRTRHVVAGNSHSIPAQETPPQHQAQMIPGPLDWVNTAIPGPLDWIIDSFVVPLDWAKNCQAL